MPTADESESAAAHTTSTLIGVDDLDALVDEGARHALFDVRERGEYALGHIPGACPMPRGLVEILAPTLVPWRSTPVVVYSDDSHRSSLAAATLTCLGYADVRVLDGGITQWRALGRTPEEGVNVLGKTYGEKVSTTGGVEQLEPDELAALQDDGDVLILDARTRIEYDRGHIPGAVSLPGGELPSTLLSIPPERLPSTIVVHCAGRTRSILGARLVMDLGFERVFALRNGTMAWRMSGRSIEYESNEPVRTTNSRGAERAADFARRFIDGQDVHGWSPAAVLDSQRNERPLYLVDVRQVDEFESEHPEGAINCPVGQLANAADEQLAVRAADIVCCSADETRAKVGAGLLRRIGYPNVGWLRGGVRGWQAGGLPVANGRPPSYPTDLDAEIASSDPMTVADLQRALEGEQIVVVDVRRSSEFALGHLPSSKWVPRGDLERRIGAVCDVDTDVVLVSDRGVRAALAARTARELGYARVRVLDGGFEAWLATVGDIEVGLDGANVSLREAKEDAELVAPRPPMLERNRDDMVRYLTWEEQLGHAFETTAAGAEGPITRNAGDGEVCSP